MEKGITHVGLDVSKRSIAVAVKLPGGLLDERSVPNEPRAVARWAKRVQQQAPGAVVCAYEAGPTGYVLQRQLEGLGVTCQVIAPALTPRRPGERVKTDRRDARKLAELLAGGLLTEVHSPTAEHEAVRDLWRAREDGKQDLLRARHRLGKFLLRRGLEFGAGRKAWTQAHRLWLRGLRLDHRADQAVFDDYCLAIAQLETRLRGLEEQLAAWAKSEPYATPVAWLRCFHGIDTMSAMGLVSELHDFRRFPRARQLMAYVGLVPSEDSSGERTRRGGITKAGNTHVRKLLIEAAWHYRHRPAVGYALRKRREGQPTRVVAIADRAQQRLCRRHQRLLARGKPSNKITVAIARELVGFLWAALAVEAA